MKETYSFFLKILNCVEKMKTRGVLIGRFQPFHKAHARVLKKILEKEDEVIVGIGSAQASFTIKNPLTAGERIEILRSYLQTQNLLEKVYIIPIPDIKENAVWPARVKEYTPKFHRVYSGNELVLSLFERTKISTVKLQMIKREEYEGTHIRKNIIKGRKWKHLVPKEILPRLEEINFSERIKRLSSS